MIDESYWLNAFNEAEMVSSGRYDTEIIKNIEESKLGSTSLQAMFGEKSLERIKAGFHGFRADSLYHNADSYSQASVLLGLPVLDERLSSRRERYSAPPPEPKPDY